MFRNDYLREVLIFDFQTIGQYIVWAPHRRGMVLGMFGQLLFLVLMSLWKHHFWATKHRPFSEMTF